MATESPVVLSFNPTNWLTVTLMGLISLSIIALIFKWRNSRSKGDA